MRRCTPRAPASRPRRSSRTPTAWPSSTYGRRSSGGSRSRSRRPATRPPTSTREFTGPPRASHAVPVVRRPYLRLRVGDGGEILHHPLGLGRDAAVRHLTGYGIDPELARHEDEIAVDDSL